MSTHSAIGILNEDGTISAVYCHNNGYPSGSKFDVGVLLQKHYHDEKKVLELMQLGDLSELGKDVNPDPAVEHTWDNPQEGVTIAYHRDRGDELIPASTFDSVADYVKHAKQLDAEFLYLYDPNYDSWSVYSIYDERRWVKLEGN